uniref:cytoplasmic tRNA 2-thiolation protein 1 n=1 Tax=Myxine glutinosa TaxID=7769 RepID=UPI00358EEB6B
MRCTRCTERRAVLRRPLTGAALCRPCFFFVFESEVDAAVQRGRLFLPGERVAIGASGGKDSAVLAHVLKELNERCNYRVHLSLLSVDEGISGYRDASLAAVCREQQRHGLPLRIISYQDLYGWTMDKIVQQIGRRGNCTYCGVLRRGALERGARELGSFDNRETGTQEHSKRGKDCYSERVKNNEDKEEIQVAKEKQIVEGGIEGECSDSGDRATSGQESVAVLATGHNADDMAETVLLNVLRGDVARLSRGLHARTAGQDGSVPRCKPLLYSYEKEIVMYAHFKQLDYFSTECTYSPAAYRGHARALIKAAERVRPGVVLATLHSGQNMRPASGVNTPRRGVCSKCGFTASTSICTSCNLLEGLDKGLARRKIGKDEVKNEKHL